MNGITLILGLVTLAGALASVALRNLVHCALGLMVAFAGLAGLYLSLGAQFVGLVQVLVYIGAVGIVFIFAILLTRGGGSESGSLFSTSWAVGGGIALAVTGVMAAALLQSPSLDRGSVRAAGPTVRQVGESLMADYVIPLEVMALLLTAAAIGAIIVAMPEKGDPGAPPQPPPG
ncbi:MAG TPA: NADH-quinone oxidoreductase subunit J [Verrucomicrobiales bacterium]|nr:NADH-quinone oxidoreductase subunit J [Verrucomicrobiales bacterium]